jgi:GMP synthase (glutamine-hydrolysing)
VDASQRFLAAVRGVSEPERKRKIIGSEFISVFKEEAEKIGDVRFLAQGTIYPDIIESGDSKSATIKSHHNVGGLPDVMPFEKVIEPLNGLFKDEVRKLGARLGLAESLVNRQPFPGPGLAIRVIGEVTEEKLAALREADHIFRYELEKARIAADQYFAVLTNARSVGVMGDNRTYDYAVALRAVYTNDFMTCEYARIPYDVLDVVTARIVNEAPIINRVVYDITGKPPATVEWE